MVDEIAVVKKATDKEEKSACFDEGKERVSIEGKLEILASPRAILKRNEAFSEECKGCNKFMPLKFLI